MSIRSKFPLILFFIALIPMILIGMMYFVYAERYIVRQAVDTLTVLADVQEARTVEVVDKKREVLRSVLSRTQLRTTLAEHLGHLTETEDEHVDLMERILHDARAASDVLSNVYVFGPGGGLIVGTDPTLGIQESDLDELLERGSRTETVLAARTSLGTRVYLSGPLFLEGRYLGVLVIVSDAVGLLEIESDYSSLGMTGDILLARRRPDGLVEYIVPRRFETSEMPAASAMDEDAPIAVSFLETETVLYDAIDYRGEHVFAATRYLEGLDWALVVKIDREEILGPARDFAALAITIALGSLLFAVIIAVIAARAIARPLIEMADVAARFAEGDIAARIKVKKGTDELATLSRVFNTMAENIDARTTELLESYAALKKAERHREEFLNFAAHELKTPLVPVRAHLQLLDEGDYGKLSKKQKEVVSKLRKSEHRLERVINDVVDIARIRSTKLKLESEAVRVDELVGTAVKDFRAAAEQDGIEVVTDIELGLPAIEADPIRVRQVLDNLLANAVKFTGRGGKIVVSAAKGSEEIVVSVTDTGIGMSQQTLASLFRPFYQADRSYSRRYEGSGLGLAISKGIVDAHGGRVFAESPGEGSGSTVGFALPIR